MRTAFINTMNKLARRDKNIFLLTGDLGFSVLESFRKEFPGRFFNIGVAEANMVGISAGLALSGKTVFIYSIVPFVTARCFEQIRDDLCYQKLNVRIIGVGSGLSYGTAGMTHQSLEDLAIMRAIPNMTVISPGDPQETEAAILASAKHKGPIYIRMGKGKDPQVHHRLKSFSIGKGVTIKLGKDLAIFACGNMLASAKVVADNLKKRGISAGLVSMHTIKPIDKAAVLRAAATAKLVVAIEEHSIIGGLGSAIAEVLAEEGSGARLLRIGIADSWPKEVGSQDYLRKKLGLDTEAIERKILQKYRGR
ncbi:MAG: transketolase C-terminal domain-containing protein [Candidatus Omnitrophica bacterium]|nr:transketolase C-terminal domain-containing protein [Candidatus Omnitrophota bacterium]